MIQEYINKLIDNFPDHINKHRKKGTIQHIDLVLDGGLFNGSYLIGVCYFLKEMEKRGYIKIEKISGCSIGSFVALLYITNNLIFFENNYEYIIKNFKKKYCFDFIEELFSVLIPLLPSDICNKMKNKVYINYYDIQQCKKIVKYKYKNLDDIFSSIKKSSFVPLIMDGNLSYKKKYIDGLNPYIFPIEERKILYVNLHGNLKKNLECIGVKNEKTNYHRILSGVLDIHYFFIKQNSTELCSYVNDWNVIQKSNNALKILIEKIFVYILSFIIYYKYLIPFSKNSFIIKITKKIMQDIFIIFCDNYLL